MMMMRRRRRRLFLKVGRSYRSVLMAVLWKNNENFYIDRKGGESGKTSRNGQSIVCPGEFDCH